MIAAAVPGETKEERGSDCSATGAGDPLAVVVASSAIWLRRGLGGDHTDRCADESGTREELGYTHFFT